MSDKNEHMFSCPALSWIAGVLLGLAAYLIVHGRWNAGFILAAIVALVVLVGVAFLLQMVFCKDTAAETSAHAAKAATAAEERRVSARAEVAAEDPELAEENARKAIGIAAGGAEMPPAAAMVQTAEALDAADAHAHSPAKSGAKPAETAAKAKTAPATGAVAEAAPETLSAPRGGKADDLKMIKGVGPALEKTLNELGFWHYDQVANWDPEHVEWVDNRLKFKGRIARDGWIEQARQLASGGETEFSKRASKSDMYKD